MPVDAIEQYIKLHGRTAEVTQSVLEENWNAVQVYKRCQWNIEAGMAGLVYTGIDGREIESVARGLRVEFDTDLIDCIRFMEQETAKILNKA